MEQQMNNGMGLCGFPYTHTYIYIHIHIETEMAKTFEPHCYVTVYIIQDYIRGYYRDPFNYVYQ